MKSHLLLILGFIIATPFTHAVILDIDGGDPTDGIPGEFPEYVLSDNTSVIPDASQTDGTVTLTLRDESVLKWNNAGYPLLQGEQAEINFQPGFDGSDPTIGTSSNPLEAVTKGTYYTVLVESTVPIDINNLTLGFYRHDTGSPRRFFILDDANGDGDEFYTDVIADTGGDPLVDTADTSPKVLSVNPETSNITSKAYHFYISNTPNGAGNIHFNYAAIDYEVASAPVASPIVYEGFGSYAIDDPVETQATPHGGTGWAGDWYPANANVTDDDYWYAGASSLSNGAYAGTGLPSAFGHTYYSVGEQVINAHNVIRRLMNTSFNGNTGGTFYFSFLVRGTVFDANVFRFSIESAENAGRRIYLESLGTELQYRVAGSPGGGSGNPQLTATTTSSPFTSAGTYFIVGKVELTSGAGNDGPNDPSTTGDGLDNFYAQVYTDTDTVSLEPTTWTLQALGSSLDNVNEFDTISLISSNVDQYAFDEIRVGLTWQDVTGIAPSAPVIIPVGVDITLAGADVQVSFESLSSQSYTLEYSTDDMATFNPVPDQSPVAPVTGNDGTLTITDPGGTPAAGGKIFYRVSTTTP
jgi:hypothetical protein